MSNNINNHNTNYLLYKSNFISNKSYIEPPFKPPNKFISGISTEVVKTQSGCSGCVESFFYLKIKFT